MYWFGVALTLEIICSARSCPSLSRVYRELGVFEQCHPGVMCNVAYQREGVALTTLQDLNGKLSIKLSSETKYLKDTLIYYSGPASRNGRIVI